MKADHDPLKAAIRKAWRKIDPKRGRIILAEELGISVSAINAWPYVPLRHIGKVSEITGVPKYELRPDLPDLFPPPEQAA